MSNVKNNDQKDLSKLSYEELEKLANDIIDKLQDPNISLENVTQLYLDGQEVANTMEKRLNESLKKVKDIIKDDWFWLPQVEGIRH